MDPVEVACSNDLLGLVCDEDVFDPNLLGISDPKGFVVREIFKKIELTQPDLMVARLGINQKAGMEVRILVEGDEFWENLPQSVSIDVDMESNQLYADIYCVTVPYALVELGPHCIAPVFDACIEGVCHCRYVLCGSDCQLKPCRFAAAILGFGENVTTSDIYVLTCAYRGARIVDHDCDCNYEGGNYSTITGVKFVDEMDIKVMTELSESKIRLATSKPRCIHSLGGVEKSNGTLRPITDCSQPEGLNINLHMDTTCEKFTYKTVDTVVDMLWPGDHGAVSDIESAYRTVHIIPSHRTYQGFRWRIEGELYCMEDLRLCFGLRCAPYIFTQFSDFIVKCCNKLGVARCVNYLDDFVVLGHSESDCAEYQSVLHRVLCNFGFKVATKKVTKSSPVFKYLGIIVDSIKMTVSIDKDKLCRVRTEVLALLDKKVCKRKTLEEVSGLLAHCAKVVKGGRTFARRIYNALKEATSDTIVLDEVIQQDFIWWASFIHWFNGKAQVLGAQHVDLTVYTDSSNYGFGAHTSDDYFWGVWGQESADCPHSENPPLIDKYDDHINVTELWPVVVAVHKWGVRSRNSTLMIVTDNTQVQSWVNTGRSINPYAMAWLREIFWVAAFFNLNVKACRISSVDNRLADALSRLNSVDCIDICDFHISEFSTCCRVARAACGME